MRRLHFDQHSLDDAWQHVLLEFEAAGMAEPAPGFVSRWETRLAEQRRVEQRRQALILLGINIIVVLSILSLLVGFSYPYWTEPSGLLVAWVSAVSRALVFVNMVSGVLASLMRTLPNLLPASWLTSMAVSMVGLILLWLVTFKQYALRQGVK